MATRKTTLADGAGDTPAAAPPEQPKTMRDHGIPEMPRALVTPLFVLLEVMRARWSAVDLEGAVQLAKIAAPYVHGRVPASQPIEDISDVTDEQLMSLRNRLRARAAGQDTDEPE